MHEPQTVPHPNDNIKFMYNIYIYVYTRGALQVLCGNRLPETPTGAYWTYLMFLFEFGMVLDTPQGPTSYLLQKSLVSSWELRPSSKSTLFGAHVCEHRGTHTELGTSAD